jgi:superfamily I DNA/RNA helicase
MELRARQVEYRRIGKSIWENPVIAGYLSFLQSLYDNSTVGVLSVLRYHGIEEGTKSALLREMDGHAGSFLDGAVPELPGTEAAERKKLQDLANSCAYWRNQLRPNATGTGGSVREVIIEVGDLYAMWMGKPNPAKLVNTCAGILSNLNGTLSSRLRLVTTKSRSENKDPLLLMTMHGSKGLEFESVHVIDASASDNDSSVVN